MSVVQALVMGLVQGLTSFLPVSSSGHAFLLPFVFGWHRPTAGFGVAVHAGTLVALLIVFRPRVVDMLRALRKPDEPNRALLRLIFISTLPAAVVALALSSVVGRWLDRPVVTSLFLGFTGWALIHGERIAREKEDVLAENRQAREVAAMVGEEPPEAVTLVTEEAEIPPVDAAVVGAAQSVAILPGMSRTGLSVVSGLARGLSRETAVRYALLLGIPATFGSILAHVADFSKSSARGSIPALVVAAVASVVAGVIAIRLFMKLITRRGLKPFGVYCFLAATAGILASLARG